LRLFSFGGYGLAPAALALVVFGNNAPLSDYESYVQTKISKTKLLIIVTTEMKLLSPLNIQIIQNNEGKSKLQKIRK